MEKINEKNKEYTLVSPYWLCCDASDRRRLRFHIESDEYFVNLATLLSFVEEKIKILQKEGRTWYALSNEIHLLEKIKEDLLYMQKNYRVEKKSKRWFR